MADGFDAATVQQLADVDEVEIETQAASGDTTHRTIIWPVVVGGEVYVRSYKGPRGRWYRELLVQPDAVALRVGEQRVAGRAIPVDDEPMIAAVSAEFLRKYASSPFAAPMVAPEVLHTTVLLVPR